MWPDVVKWNRMMKKSLDFPKQKLEIYNMSGHGENPSNYNIPEGARLCWQQRGQWSLRARSAGPKFHCFERPLLGPRSVTRSGATQKHSPLPEEKIEPVRNQNKKAAFGYTAWSQVTTRSGPKLKQWMIARDSGMTSEAVEFRSRFLPRFDLKIIILVLNHLKYSLTVLKVH